MKTGWLLLFFTLAAVAIFALAQQADAQRTRGPKVTSLSASIEKDGPHPDKAELAGPAPIMCISAISDLPKSPTPSCHIVAPGFTGNLAAGKSANATEAGTVTLTCNGQGWVRCHARIN
jgi:hypothetical protein